MSHIPVLLQEVLAVLNPQPGEFWIDGTLDGGGHAQAILERIGPKGKLLGVDWDEEMVTKASSKFDVGRSTKNLFLTAGNYADLPEILARKKLPRADGLLLDLGFSSTQLEVGRGFSFLEQGPLLMTYSAAQPPVREILRRLSEQELADIIFRFGGERFARRIARAIKTSKHQIETVSDLREAIARAVPGFYERGRIHSATRTFQALRIYANAELENLERLLREIPQILAPGGRVGIITFHSLEDRLVKNGFRTLARPKHAKLLTLKPIEASAQELLENPRSRSAKLRAIEIKN